MKDCAIRQRQKIKAQQIKRGDVIEVGGQRIRADRLTEGDRGYIAVTQLYQGRSSRSRRMTINPRKKVDLVRR